MQRVFILAAVRSPIAPKGGALRGLSMHALGEQTISALLARGGLKPADVQGLMAGNALGAGGNPARLVALAADLPECIPAQTIDTQCCSGLDAIALCAHRLALATGPMCWIAGGIESASNAPLRARRSDDGSPEFYDEAQFSPWPNRNPSMLDAALALEAQMRNAQVPGSTEVGAGSHRKDSTEGRNLHYEYAIASHALSMRAGHLDRVPIGIDEMGQVLHHDPHTRVLTQELCRRAEQGQRKESTLNLPQSLQMEQPRWANPALIAPLADGAAFALLVNESFLAERRPTSIGSANSPGPVAALQREGLVEVIDSHQMGANPEQPGLAIHALMPWLITSLQRAAQNQTNAADAKPVHIELMESFTAQAISNRRAIEGALQAAGVHTPNPSCINPFGGLLAMGHPIGASGAVLVGRLVNQLQPGQLGFALIASAGGLASGLLLRRANSAASSD